MNGKNKILFLFLTTFLFWGCQKKQIVVEGPTPKKQEQSSAHQEKKEIEKTSSIKIGVITDIHKCDARSPGKMTAERLQEFVDDVDSKGVDLNVNLGDNIRYRMDFCADGAPTELAWTIDSLKTKAPIKYVLSDHDIDDKESFEYWKRTTKTPETFYSFDEGDFHIVVLDTITGDGIAEDVCQGSSHCHQIKKDYDFFRNLFLDEGVLQKYLIENKTTKKALEAKKLGLENQYKTIRAAGPQLALIEKRDAGQILLVQLEWLRNDLANTDKEKVIIFSDHPLFLYEGKRKVYDTVGRKEISGIFKASNKQIVSISGETHEWHDEIIDGVQYYLIGKFGQDDVVENWAIFEWDEEGYSLQEVSTKE